MSYMFGSPIFFIKEAQIVLVFFTYLFWCGMTWCWLLLLFLVITTTGFICLLLVCITSSSQKLPSSYLPEMKELLIGFSEIVNKELLKGPQLIWKQVARKTINMIQELSNNIAYWFTVAIILILVFNFCILILISIWCSTCWCSVRIPNVVYGNTLVVLLYRTKLLRVLYQPLLRLFTVKFVDWVAQIRKLPYTTLPWFQ